MGITTQFSSENYITSSIQILIEFILSYLSNDEIDIATYKPSLDETIPLTKPIIYLELMPGSNPQVPGMGRVINQNGLKGQFQNMSIMLWIIIDDNVGGSDKCKQIAETLSWIFLTHGGDLGQAGLTNSQISTLREFPKDGSSVFYGGRQMISYRLLQSYQ